MILESDRSKAIKGEYFAIAKPVGGLIAAHYVNKMLGLKRLTFRLPIIAAGVIGFSFLPIDNGFSQTRQKYVDLYKRV